MAKHHCYSRRVEFRDTDAAGIVHFSVFFNYMEEAEHALLRECSLDVFMTDEEGKLSFPRVAAECDYRSPLRFGDVVSIAVSVSEIGRASVTYRFEFARDGTEIAVGQVTAVCCRLSNSHQLQPVAVPEGVRDSLSNYAS